MRSESDSTERIPIYEADPVPMDHVWNFKAVTNNLDFKANAMTYLSLFVLIILYPGISLGFNENPTELLKSLDKEMLNVLLIFTIVMQWSIFILLFLSVFIEKTGLLGLGFKKIRMVDFAWAIAFLVASNLILSGLAWVLAQFGLPMLGEVALLIPTDTTGRIIWVAVSFTAGFCEETAFRGYLMTRLRITGRLKSWIIPVIVSSLAFGACHAYQGLPGLIVITVYGALFALLYIRTGRIWPCIIAHFFQDFSALFIPQ